MGIPARIIQSHESEYTFRKVFTSCRERLLELHPSFEYCFYSAAKRREFIATHRPELLEVYDFYPRNIQKADFFRILAMHQVGGFYLDLDVRMYLPLSELCDADLVLTEEWQMSEEEYMQRHRCAPSSDEDLVQIGNYAFAASPKHWFFEAVLEEMVGRTASINPSTCTTEDVFFSTGPDVVSAVYARNRDRLQNAAVILKGSEKGRWCQFGSYGTHLMSGSWF